MELALKDRTVFVTGASGGIGRALVIAFAQEGANVAAHAYRGGAELRAWLANQPFQDRVLAVEADIRDPVALRKAFTEAARRFGRVEICVANAGARPEEAAGLRSAGVDRVRTTIEANLLGAIWTAKAFLEQIDGSEEGAALLFIGSTAASFGEQGFADYAAAKSGLTGLVRTLKNEIVRIDPKGRVNLLEPGWTRTHVPRPALEDLEAIRRVVRTMPLRQLARAEDVARTALWLCSPLLGRHITGQTITVAGGMEGRLLWEPDEIDPAAIRRAAGLQ